MAEKIEDQKTKTRTGAAPKAGDVVDLHFVQSPNAEPRVAPAKVTKAGPGGLLDLEFAAGHGRAAAQLFAVPQQIGEARVYPRWSLPDED